MIVAPAKPVADRELGLRQAIKIAHGRRDSGRASVSPYWLMVTISITHDAFSDRLPKGSKAEARADGKGGL